MKQVDPDVFEEIEKRARTNGDFAIAYALLSIANAIYTTARAGDEIAMAVRMADFSK